LIDIIGTQLSLQISLQIIFGLLTEV